MQIYPTAYSRAEYIQTQIARSQKKFGYCKVSASDPRRYLRVIRAFCHARSVPFPGGPVLCLGTRNGREVDVFRAALFSPVLSYLLTVTELRLRGFLSLLDVFADADRSRVDTLTPRSVVGVEINPQAARQDVWVGSFDAMPQLWEEQFSLVYSNSFDQSQNPQPTAAEWMRITQPGGFLIIAFGINKQPSATDPVGNLILPDILTLFPGELVYFTAAGTLYAEAIIRKPKLV